MNILDCVRTGISELKDQSRLAVADIYACSPFTVVRLNDGSFGSAGNYDVQNHTRNYDCDAFRRERLLSSESDPLLTNVLRNPRSFADLSLKVAILSALSQSLLVEGPLFESGLKCTSYTNADHILKPLLREGDRVVLVGYGGAFDLFCVSRKVRQLIICDLMFATPKYRKIAWARAKTISQNPSKISLVCDPETEAFREPPDIVYITGSALCNGTMERLLELAMRSREIVVQGPSCSLYPIELFRRGITLLLTNRKTHAEFNAGKTKGNKILDFVDLRNISISRLGRPSIVRTPFYQ